MVELRDYLAVLRARWMLLLLCIAGGVTLAVLLLPRLDDVPRASVIASVRVESLPDSALAVQYDGYYLVETERRFGDVLGQTLLRSDLAESVAEQGATLGLVRRISPLDYRVLLRGTTTPGPAATALQEQLSELIRDAAERSGETSVFSATVSSPELLPARWSALRSGFVGGLLGMLFAASWALWALYQSAARAEELVETVATEVLD
jgi:hypothetical protein